MGLFDIFRVGKIKAENEALKQKLQDLHADEYWQVKEHLDRMNSEIAGNNITLSKQHDDLSTLSEQSQKLEKQVTSQRNKIARSKELYQSIEYALDTFLVSDVSYNNCRLNPHDKEDLEELVPSVILKLHCMDVKDLRKAYRENAKQIDRLMDLYEARYTTKANKSIYSLMVIALKAELQNVLYNLKYDKLDSSIENIRSISSKYLKIAGEGNQSIAGTLTKFIGELEYLFINAVKIEYNYYVRKEQAKQEQLALKEQMRQEAEERKALEAERKKVEKEESKFKTEIDKLTVALSESTSASDKEQLHTRILDLQKQLSDIIIKKDEIVPSEWKSW